MKKRKKQLKDIQIQIHIRIHRLILQKNQKDQTVQKDNIRITFLMTFEEIEIKL